MPGVEGTMKEFKAGSLHSGSKSGPVVTNPKQAIAIGLSEERKSKNDADGGPEAGMEQGLGSHEGGDSAKAIKQTPDQLAALFKKKYEANPGVAVMPWNKPAPNPAFTPGTPPSNVPTVPQTAPDVKPLPNVLPPTTQASPATLPPKPKGPATQTSIFPRQTPDQLAGAFRK